MSNEFRKAIIRLHPQKRWDFRCLMVGGWTPGEGEGEGESAGLKVR